MNFRVALTNHKVWLDCGVQPFEGRQSKRKTNLAREGRFIKLKSLKRGEDSHELQLMGDEIVFDLATVSEQLM